jgi:hypothetical protein
VVVAVAVAVPLLVSGSDTATRQPGGTPTPTAETPFRPANLLPWPRPDALEIFGSSINYLSPIGRLMGEPDYARVGYQPLWTGSVEGSAAVTVGEAWKGTEPARLVTVGAGDQLGPVVDPSQSVVAFAVGRDKGTLIVVAAPDATVEYASNGNGYQPISDIGQAPKGVGLVPIEAEDPNDTIRVTEADGSQVVQPAPDWTAPAGSPPANLLTTWIHRGDATQQPPTSDVLHAFTQAVGRTDESKAHYLSLFDGVSRGVRYTIGQAYYDGDRRAHTFGYTTGGTSGPQAFLGPETPMDTELVALLVDSIPGSSTDLLVLVPRPGTGQLSYAPDASSKLMPVASGRSDLNGIGLVDRSQTATNDRIEQLDGDGNIDRPIYRGPLAPFLCAAKACG